MDIEKLMLRFCWKCGKPRRNEPPGNFYAQNFMGFRGEIFLAIWYAVRERRAAYGEK